MRGAEVYALGTTREQAMTVFKPAMDNIKRWARMSPGIRRVVKVHDGLNQERLTLDGTSLFRPLPANDDAMDGLNPSAILFDELHAQKTRGLWDVMESALGARRQPLLSAISTAGYVLDGICTELLTYLTRILRGEIQDDDFFGYCYTVDADDDPLGKVMAYLKGKVSDEDLAECAKLAGRGAMDADVAPWLDLVRRIYLPQPVANYIARLVDATHPGQSTAARGIRYGASPRAALSLASAAKARALIHERPHASFEDVRFVAGAVLRHRIVVEYNARIEGLTANDLVRSILDEVPFQSQATPRTMVNS
jgi:hypothetical protein